MFCCCQCHPVCLIPFSVCACVTHYVYILTRLSTVACGHFHMCNVSSVSDYWNWRHVLCVCGATKVVVIVLLYLCCLKGSFSALDTDIAYASCASVCAGIGILCCGSCVTVYWYRVVISNCVLQIYCMVIIDGLLFVWCWFLIGLISLLHNLFWHAGT